MKEKLQEYALIAEIIGGIAIVISLVFVGIQIQQGTEETALNTSAIRTSAYQELTGQILDIYNNLSSSPQMAEIYYKANCGQALTPQENIQLGIFSIQIFRHADMAHQMYQQGLIDREQFLTANSILFANISQSQYFLDHWHDTQAGMRPEFFTEIEEIFNEYFPDGVIPSPWCR